MLREISLLGEGPIDFVWLDRNVHLQDAQKACPARPQRVKARGIPLRYVEGLKDARTPLADFFSTLLCCDVGWRDISALDPVEANVRLRLFHERDE